MGVDADLGFGSKSSSVSPHPIAYIVHREPSTRIGDVNTMGASGFHALRLFGESIWRAHVRHHQKSGDVHSQFPCGCNVLIGNVGLGAVGGNPDRPDTNIVSVLQVVDGADSRHEQTGQDRVLQHRSSFFDPLGIGMRSKAIVERRPRQTVTMGHFDRINSSFIESDTDVADLRQRIAMSDGVHTIA